MTKNILIIGCGSIGRRHLANLKRIGLRDLIICDTNQARLNKAAKEFNIQKKFTDYKKAVRQNDDIKAAIICSPTNLHVSQALFLAKKGINLLIEKPLSHNRNNVDFLLDIVEKKKLICMMAMCYRFDAGFLKLKDLIDKGAIGKLFAANLFGGSYLPYWHPQMDYRIEYSAKKSMGGGVILTSIHSLDIIRWLFGEVKEVGCFCDKISNLEIDTEDTAAFIFRLKNNMLVNLYLDFLQRVKQHKITMVGELGNIEADFIENKIKIFNIKTKKWHKVNYKAKKNDIYIKEMQYFIDCLSKNKKPTINLSEGIKTLELALAAKESSKAKKILKL
jgi:predicted dehydrogenase